MVRDLEVFPRVVRAVCTSTIVSIPVRHGSCPLLTVRTDNVVHRVRTDNVMHTVRRDNVMHTVRNDNVMHTVRTDNVMHTVRTDNDMHTSTHR